MKSDLMGLNTCHFSSFMHVMHFIQPHVQNISLKHITVVGLIRHMTVIQLHMGRKVF